MCGSTRATTPRSKLLWLSQNDKGRRWVWQLRIVAAGRHAVAGINTAALVGVPSAGRATRHGVRGSGKRMDVFPAIDLRGGKCLGLYQGDYEKE